MTPPAWGLVVYPLPDHIGPPFPAKPTWRSIENLSACQARREFCEVEGEEPLVFGRQRELPHKNLQVPLCLSRGFVGI